MAFKVVIGDPSTGKCEQKESDDAATKALTGLKIGDTVKGELFGLPGRTLVVTGGSDDCGFPMRRDISGTLRKRILITGGVGFDAREKGQGRRKTVAGNTIHGQTHQVNLKIQVEKKAPAEKAPKAEKVPKAKKAATANAAGSNA